MQINLMKPQINQKKKRLPSMGSHLVWIIQLNILTKKNLPKLLLMAKMWR